MMSEHIWSGSTTGDSSRSPQLTLSSIWEKSVIVVTRDGDQAQRSSGFKQLQRINSSLSIRTVYYSRHVALLTFVQIRMVQECTDAAIPLRALLICRLTEQGRPLVLQSRSIWCLPERPQLGNIECERTPLACVNVPIKCFT